MSTKAMRLSMGICAVILFAAEVYIGVFQHGNWVRAYLGDVLVIMLLYAVVRCISPRLPKIGWVLPTALLAFSFCVEFLQKWGFADKLHITNKLLRTLIGTSFSWKDILSYIIGFVPLLLFEQIVKKHSR